MLTKNDLSLVGNLVTGIVQKELKPVKKDLKKIRKDLEFAINVLDQDRLNLENRFDAHLHYLH